VTSCTHLLISLQHLMHIPNIVDREDIASCKALLWLRDRQALVLLVDLGTGASVASSADMLIPYVISSALFSTKERIHWSRTRWFQCDMEGYFDEIQVEQYRGGMSAEITCLPRPRPLRTAAGFASLVASDGFNVLDTISDFVATQRELAASDADHARSLHACGN